MTDLEQTFLDAWGKYGMGRIPVTPDDRYMFGPPRRYLCDFAWPRFKVMVELDGLGPGHGIAYSRKYNPQTLLGATIKAISDDHDRQNYAVSLGWRVFRFTARQLGSEKLRKQACELVLKAIQPPTKRRSY